MGENTKAAEATAENTEKKKKKEAKPAEEDFAPQHHEKKQKQGSRWTLALCKKAARRFSTREEWAKGAPSAYKSAVAHGWDAECVKAMTPRPATTSAPAKTRAKKTARTAA